MDHNLPKPDEDHPPPSTPSGAREVVIRETHTLETAEDAGEIMVDEVIDLEIYVREQRRVPLARAYRIRVDKQHFVVETPTLLAKDILVLAGKAPVDKYVLRQIVHGHPVKLELGDRVDFRTPGVEKFKTMLKTAQDGVR